jgi:flagellar protein FlaJ
MAIIPSALSPISRGLDNIIPERYIVIIQENLIRSGMFVKASDLLTLMLLGYLLFGVLGLIFFTIVGIYPLIGIIVGLIIPPTIVFGWLFFSIERRVDAIEQATPDFLRQIASLRAGVGIETALEDISKQGGGPLTDELKRAVIEIKIGSTFDHALL